VSKKNSKSVRSIPMNNARIVILGIVLLGVELVIGGKHLIQSRATERREIIVPPLSPNGKLGQVAFQTNCAACHGVNAAGTDNGPPLVNDIYRPGHHADFSFVRAASLEVPQHHWFFGNMPAQPQVPRKEIDLIIGYVRELQRANGIR